MKKQRVQLISRRDKLYLSGYWSNPLWKIGGVDTSIRAAKIFFASSGAGGDKRVVEKVTEQARLFGGGEYPAIEVDYHSDIRS